MSAPKPRFPAARIKKMMQADDNVGRIAAPVPIIISKCLELFAAELVTKSAAHASNDAAKTLQAAHIKKCVESEELFDFLRTTVNEVPEQAPKRARAAGAGASKRSKPSTSTATAAAAAATAMAGGAILASEHRPLADEDDDYDAV